MSEPMSGLGLVPMESEAQKHTRRLQRLIAILEAVPPERFDMKYWGRHPADHEPPTEAPDCGTVACAMGWAAFDPELRREGLSVRWLPVNRRDDHSGLRVLDFYDAQIALDGELLDMEVIVRRFLGLTGDSNRGEAQLFWRTYLPREGVLAALRELAVNRDELHGAPMETE